MKRIFLYVLSALLFAVSCEPDHKEDHLPAAGVYFINFGLQKAPIFDTQKTLTYPVYAYCGGFYDADPVVEVRVDEAAMVRFNDENYTSYKVLPRDCYSLDITQVKMNRKKAVFNIVFNVEKLLALSTKDDYSDIQEYLVPLSLKSLTEGVSDPVSDAVGCEFIKPVLSEVLYDIVSCNSYNPAYPIDKINDGDLNTYWESASSNVHTGSTIPPYEIVMELPMTCDVSGFEVYRYPQITTRQKEKVTIEVSTDNFNYEKVVDVQYGSDNTNNTAGPIEHSFPAIATRYIRYRVTESTRKSYDGLQLAALAEFNVIIK